MKLGKLQRAHHTHFAPTYLGGSIKLRAYLFFIYGARSSGQNGSDSQAPQNGGTDGLKNKAYNRPLDRR